MQGIVKPALALALCVSPLLAHGSWSSVSASTGAVYKCEQGGQVAYQGTPCPLDAKQTPARREQQTQEEREAVEALVQRAEKVSQEAVRANAIEKPNGDKAALPAFDVEASCEEVASATGSYSATTYNGCIRLERDAYRSMKSSYGNASMSARQNCEEIATASDGGSYSTLKGCMRMERDAAANKETF